MPAEHGEQMFEVVWLSLVRQSHHGACSRKSSSQHRLKQRMRCNLDHDGVVWNMLKSFLEQHRTDEIIDVVVGRRVECQLRGPLWLCYRRTDPTFCTHTTLDDYLDQSKAGYAAAVLSIDTRRGKITRGLRLPPLKGKNVYDIEKKKNKQKRELLDRAKHTIMSNICRLLHPWTQLHF